MRILLLVLMCLIACKPSTSIKKSYLYVQLAQGGTLSPNLLTLHNVDDQVLYFSDKPIREAGHISVSEFLNSFTKDLPNAAIEIRDGDKRDVFVVELSNPRFDAVQKTLVYDIKSLDSALPTRSFEHVSLFIDNQSLPACNASDQKVAIYPGNKPFWQQAHQCTKDAMANADKTAQCLIGYYPTLSLNCAQAIGDMTHCVATNCLFKCMFNQMSSGCISCADQNCNASTYTGISKNLLPQ